MSYADSVISRYEATVDDEYQRILLHQSSTIAFTATMWMCYILAVVFIWTMPGKTMEIAAMIMLLVPAAGTLVGQVWLRRRVPLPRINRISAGEIIALIIVIGLLLLGIARSRNMEGGELIGYFSGAIVGAGMGIAGVLIVFKLIYPHLRHRDQRRLDRKYDQLEED